MCCKSLTGSGVLGVFRVSPEGVPLLRISQETRLAVEELGGLTRGMLLVLLGLGQRCAVAELVNSHVVFGKLLQSFGDVCAVVFACSHEDALEVLGLSGGSGVARGLVATGLVFFEGHFGEVSFGLSEFAECFYVICHSVNERYLSFLSSRI